MGLLILHAIIDRQTWNSRRSAGTMLASAFLLGQGTLANLWLLIALPGWFSPFAVAWIVLVLAASGVALDRRKIIDLSSQLRAIGNDLWKDSWGWRILAILTLVLCLAWITSLGRPLSLDGAKFYMALPKVVAETHQLRPLPGNYDDFTSIGLQGEMHHAALMSLGSPDAARLFDWPTVLAGAVMLLALGRQIGLGRRGQWIALAMLFTSSAVIWLSGFGKTDLYAAALGLAAFYWTAQLRCDEHHTAQWLVGFFSGYAIIAKITYIPAMMPGIILLFGWAYVDYCRQPEKLKLVVARTFHIGRYILAGFLLAVAPHLIKNSLLFQNPFAPLGLDTSGWLIQEWYGPDTTRHIIQNYPLALTYGNYFAQLGNLSPLVLAFIPLVILLPRSKSLTDSPLLMVSIAALAGVATWTIVRPSVFAPRYLLASLLLFILPAARGAEYASQHERKPRWLTSGVMASIALTIITVGLAYHNFVFYPLKTYLYLMNKLDECGRETQYCEPMVSVNRIAELGARVFTNSHHRYWLRSDLIQCMLTSEEIENYSSLQTDEERWDFIYSHGFHYLIAFDNPPGIVYRFIPLPSLGIVPDWLSITYMQGGNNPILRLESRDSNHSVSVVCRQQDPYIWKLVSPNFSPPN
jgi:hypothetical protein